MFRRIDDVAVNCVSPVNTQSEFRFLNTLKLARASGMRDETARDLERCKAVC